MTRANDQPGRVKCRSCGSQRMRVKKVRYRPSDDSVVRRLQCLDCGTRVRTAERVEDEKTDDQPPVT
jgi:transcriptional regulator NrdR family protein